MKADSAICIVRETVPTFHQNSQDSVEFNMHCMVPDKTTFCNQYRSKINMLFEKTTEEFVNGTMSQLEKLIQITKSGKSKDKRFIEAAIGFFTGSVLTGVFSLYEQAKISRQLNEFYGQFEEFRNEVTDYMKSSTEFHQGMLKMYKVMESNVEDSLENINCEMMSIVRYIMDQNNLLRWKHYIQTLSKDLVDGQFKGSISPTVINESDVENLIQHQNLADSVYSGNVPLFYRLGRMWLADVKLDGQYFNFHVIISVPHIQNNQLFILYKVDQVGLVNNTKCFKLDLPQHVYQKNGKFFELDNENNCEDRNGIKLCLANRNTAKQSKCVTNHPLGCKVMTDECRMRFVQTSSGVMVRAMYHLKLSHQDNPNEYIDVVNGSTVKFLDYKEFYHILADNHVISTIGEPLLSKELPLENPDEWDKYLVGEMQTLQKTNLSNLHQNIIQQEQIIQSLQSKKYLTTKHVYSSGGVIGGFIASLALCCVLYWLYQWRHRINTNHEDNSGESITIPDPIIASEDIRDLYIKNYQTTVPLGFNKTKLQQIGAIIRQEEEKCDKDEDYRKRRFFSEEATMSTRRIIEIG